MENKPYLDADERERAAMFRQLEMEVKAYTQEMAQLTTEMADAFHHGYGDTGVYVNTLCGLRTRINDLCAYIVEHTEVAPKQPSDEYNADGEPVSQRAQAWDTVAEHGLDALKIDYYKV